MVDQAVIDRVKKFIGFFGPSEDVEEVPSEYLEKYVGVLPTELLLMWANLGFGNYGDGVLKLIDPELFKKNLDKWRGKEDEHAYPFMITAFGDMFYLRYLPDGSEEVRLLSIIYKKEKVCAKSFLEFFTVYILSRETIYSDLKASLFIEAEEKIGKLDNDSIYTFVPSINFGGKETVESIQIADAFIYQDIAYGD